MRLRHASVALVAMAVFGFAWAAPAQADVDADFATTLHGYGIYGQRDYNAWLAKITCTRLSTGADADASASAVFLSRNLTRATSTEQVWQFLGAATSRYCPQHTSALTVMAKGHA